MKITWIGHSCFKIEEDGYTIITDPYEDGYVPGLKKLREKADLVLCSHEHGDHNARQKVKLIKGGACPFKITKIETWHDEVKGAKRGPNAIHIIEGNGVKLAHLGDLGCMPEKDQMEELKDLTVCLVPVGGFFTIDGREAAALMKELNPRTIIPMHYRDDEKGFGFDKIDTVKTFADLMGACAVTGADTLRTDQLPNEQTVILTPRDLAR